MHCICFLRKGVVYIPTLGMMDKGLYRHIEPVAIAPLSNTDGLRAIFAGAFARGNPTVPLPKQPDASPSPLLKYAGTKTWRTFARDASTWSIDERDGTYKIQGYRKDAPNGWVRDKSQDETFRAGTLADKVIERMIAILQEGVQNQVQ